MLIADLVHVLAVSEPTFQRDFDAISSEIARLTPDADGHDYAAYVRDLRRSSAAFGEGVLSQPHQRGVPPAISSTEDV
jgi:hypothetical protein